MAFTKQHSEENKAMLDFALSILEPRRKGDRDKKDIRGLMANRFPGVPKKRRDSAILKARMRIRATEIRRRDNGN